MLDLAVIIVNYNGGRLLYDTVTAVFETPPACDFKVVIVDNGSTDDSVAAAVAGFPSVDVIGNGENLGFARANNIGMAHARAGQYLLLNSDALVVGDAIDTLRQQALAIPEAGIVGPRLVYPDGTDQRTARRFPTPLNALFGRKSLLTRLFPNNAYVRKYMPPAPGPSPYQVDWISGACFLVKDEVLQDVGRLDERYFMYWEDADFCYRANDNGWRVYCVPAATVVHHEGASSKRRGNRLIWEFHKSVLYFYKKNYLGGRHPWLGRAASLALFSRAFFLIVANRICNLACIHHSVERK